MPDPMFPVYRESIKASFVLDYLEGGLVDPQGSGHLAVIHNPKDSFKRHILNSFILEKTRSFRIEKILISGVLGGEKSYALPTFGVTINDSEYFSQMLSWQPSFPDVGMSVDLVPNHHMLDIAPKAEIKFMMAGHSAHSKFRIELRGFLRYPADQR